MRRRTFLIATAAALLGAPARAAGVPLYRQEHALTCEAAALRMALGSLGVEVTEGDILDRLARDPTPRQVQSDGSIVWGDPDVGFVGAFDGTFAVDGYGVYDGPICDVAQSFGFSGSTHQRGTDPSSVYWAVRQGAPTLVWVPYALSVRGRGAWFTPDGRTVEYVVTEHCVVVADVTDTGVVYADPWEAVLKTADFATFEAAFGEIDNRAVMVSA